MMISQRVPKLKEPLSSVQMDDFGPRYNITFSLNLTSFLVYFPTNILAKFMDKLKPSLPTPTQLDLISLPATTISDLLATTNEWDVALPLITKAGENTPFGSSPEDDKSILLGPLGFFMSKYILVLLFMVSF